MPESNLVTLQKLKGFSQSLNYASIFNIKSETLQQPQKDKTNSKTKAAFANPFTEFFLEKNVRSERLRRLISETKLKR